MNSTMPIEVRVAALPDAEIIADFNFRLAAESENRQLDRSVLARGVAALLADPGKGRYFLASVGDTVVGQLMHTFEWSDWRNGMIWWLQSVYIVPDFRGRGVFRRLFQQVAALAHEEPGVAGIRLYVDHRNVTARAAYQRVGLTPAGYDVLEHIWSDPS